MNNERIPIQRAREISERHGWPQVIVIGFDAKSELICFTSYGQDRKLCAAAKMLAEAISSSMGMHDEAPHPFDAIRKL